MAGTTKKIKKRNDSSYQELKKLPHWKLYTQDGKIVASAHAGTAKEAWAIFKRYGFSGVVIFR